MPGPLADGGAEARPWRARPGLMLIGALAFLAAIYLAPLATLIGWAFRDAKGGFTLAQAVKLASEPAYHTALATTFRTAAITTLACALLGYPLAYVTATTGPRARGLLLAAVMIPFWTSVLARTLAWIILLGRRGIVNEVLIASGIADAPAVQQPRRPDRHGARAVAVHGAADLVGADAP